MMMRADSCAPHRPKTAAAPASALSPPHPSSTHVEPSMWPAFDEVMVETGILRRPLQQLWLMQLHRPELLIHLRSVGITAYSSGGIGLGAPGRHPDSPASARSACLMNSASLSWMCALSLSIGPHKIDGRRRRVDRPAISLPRQQRQISGVVNMRVRQHHRVQPRRGLAGKLIHGDSARCELMSARVLPAALKQAAVQQDTFCPAHSNDGGTTR